MKEINRTSILVDNDSWILPYVEDLKVMLENLGVTCKLIRNENQIPNGDVCFLLGCTRIVKEESLKKNIYNLVVHESDLPNGKGFAPMAWQILDGKNEIMFSLIEATNTVDSGDIWLQSGLSLRGDELCEEWRHLQGKKTVEMCVNFVREFDKLSPRKQAGSESFFRRRTPKDSEIDTTKSIDELFELLRVVDNQRYPAFFYKNGIKYNMKIEKSDG
ncbi:hypothetical protein AB4307_04100 [Vibrio sp. 10N.261.52.C2]|uniref:hypothetical protein n=1 Tax=Vibrio sp. 10N.261.52.C2 TaxID=3229681 RepID=UPI00354EB8AB